MAEFIWFLIILVALSIASYKRASLTTAAAVVAGIMVIGTLFSEIDWLGWLVFLAIAVPLLVPSLRKQLISSKLLAFYRKVMPEMSSTEQEAIDAGTVWWDGEIFSGDPDWNKLHSIPKGRLTAEEQAFLDGPVDHVCSMVDEWQINHKDADLSPEIWAYLKEHKFFAMIIKKKYGGLEFSAFAQSRVLQKLAGTSAVLSSTVGVPNSLGPGELLQHYGTQEQQEYYLPRLAKGEEIPCFALTGPEAGSDAGAIPDVGIICKGQWEGEEIIGMRLTFNKRYITLAPIATLIGLAFKLQDPDGLLGSEEDLGITCALIPRDTEGLDIGRRHFPLNVPFQNGPIKGENIFVPLDYIIGGQKMAGRGWRMLVECLSVGRCITLPSTAAGGAKQLALATGAYARIRRQFRIPVGHMEGVEEMLARIGGNAYLMDGVTRFSTVGIGLGEKPSVISAISKYHLTEKMRQVVNDAMDVHGGKGIMLGPNNYLGRGYQGAPISITVEGANILTRNMMIFGQGAMRCHPWVLKEIHAANLEDPEERLDEFDKAVFGHIGFTLSNLVRSKWFSFTGGYLHSSPFKDSTAQYYRLLQGYSANLALLSDVSMGVLGGELKRRERLSARLGDILSGLFLASATLKRYDEDGRLHEDASLMHWAMMNTLFDIETAIDDFLANFPSKPVAFFLRAIVMPFGRRCSKPSDYIEHKVALLLQQPCSARSRLGEGQYLTREEGNPFGELEQTLDDILASEPIFDRISKQKGEKLSFTQLDKLADEALEKGWINEDEAEQLRKTEAGRLKIINVDDFEHEELIANQATKPKAKGNRKTKVA
ncbi:acyl-CoA dehydrogenase FadE [Alteromonas ponticola]|uniref:Acyl-coenzyme A dehydrogenase n=1 Tax=Alteromonas aquimaris TaxID=2998417 RepID=A0ABT3P5T3_9ALTE|nr:acyl-CoA dehydrogenase FadE [Alteromonas aquimaris]MCW8108131.1 acyl-CoA dehydrogenase FadE [Alteromonas aquimaris]